MGQVLIRSLDDELIDAYREAAAANQRSLEAELRDALQRAAPHRTPDRRTVAEQVRALLPEQVSGVSGTKIIRWYRDRNLGSDLDDF
jgi:antitoxin FitA